MFSKPFRNFGRASDGMDDHLLGIGLWRKTIAKDGRSLYRAVSEQVDNTPTLIIIVTIAIIAVIVIDPIYNSNNRSNNNSSTGNKII